MDCKYSTKCMYYSAGLALHYGYVVLIFLGTLIALGGIMYAGIYRALKNSSKFLSLRQRTLRSSQHLANLLSVSMRYLRLTLRIDIVDLHYRGRCDLILYICLVVRLR